MKKYSWTQKYSGVHFLYPVPLCKKTAPPQALSKLNSGPWVTQKKGASTLQSKTLFPSPKSDWVHCVIFLHNACRNHNNKRTVKGHLNTEIGLWHSLYPRGTLSSKPFKHPRFSNAKRVDVSVGYYIITFREIILRKWKKYFLLLRQYFF